MSDRRKEIQVGAAFLAAIVILVSGVLWFKEFQVGGEFRHITVAFTSASGLQNGDPVEVSGVVSGSVTELEYQDGKARVTLQLERNVDLYPGTEFAIVTMGLMGQKMVAITPGPVAGTPLPNSAPFSGEYQAGMGELMAGLGTTLDTVERLAGKLDATLDAFGENEREAMARTVRNLDQVSAEMADLLEETGPGMRRSIRDFESAMGTVDETLTQNREEIETAIQGASRAMGRMDSSLAQLDSTLQGLDRIVSRVAAGEGTLGRMLQDDQLYDELKTTLAETRALLADVKENPRKYLKFSVF